MAERGHPNNFRPDAAAGAPLTDQPNHEGRLLSRRESERLERAGRLDATAALLDRLTGMELVMHALTQMIGVEREAILWSGTAQITAGGTWTKTFGGESLAISVTNYTGNGNVTVCAQEPGGSAPGPGVGVHNVPAGVSQVFNNKTTVWTIYGTPGSVLDVQVFGRIVQPIAAGNI